MKQIPGPKKIVRPHEQKSESALNAAYNKSNENGDRRWQRVFAVVSDFLPRIMASVAEVM